MNKYKRFEVFITNSFILGFLIMAFISISIMVRHAKLDILSAIMIYLAHMSVVYMLLKLWKKLPYRIIEINAVFILYCIVVLIMTFGGRNYSGLQNDMFTNLQYIHYFELNPLSFIKEGDISLSILNLILFFPMPILLYMRFPAILTKKSLCIGIGVMFCIEVMQFVSNRGIFDAGDIVLYIMGYLIGLLATRFIKRYAIIERT